MKHSEHSWQSADGLKIYGQHWCPDDDPVAVVVLVHGMGEHSGRYSHVAEQFTEKGIAVFAFDHRGHGKSGGKRGHTPYYFTLLDDLGKGIGVAQKHFSGRPIILYGQSMGANVVINYILRRKPSILGVVMTSPWLKLAFEPPTLRLFASRIMNKIDPKYTEKFPLDHADLSRDPEIVKAYGEDPMVHSDITARFFFGAHEAGLWALENASQLHVPTLLMHGTADKITCHQASQEFASKAPKDLMNFHELEGYSHEIHNEPEREQILDIVSAYILGLLRNGSANTSDCSVA